MWKLFFPCMVISFVPSHWKMAVKFNQPFFFLLHVSKKIFPAVLGDLDFCCQETLKVLLLFMEAVFNTITLTDSLLAPWLYANSRAAHFKSTQVKSRSGEGTDPSGTLWNCLMGFMGVGERKRQQQTVNLLVFLPLSQNCTLHGTTQHTSLQHSIRRD